MTTSKPGPFTGRAQPEECLEIVPALVGPYPPSRGANVQRDNTGFYLAWHCCNGSGRHNSGHLNVQDAYDYPCEPCKETGEFRIQVP